MNTRKIGQHYEEVAAAYLANEGIRIIDRNVTCGRIGEIDIIGVQPSEKNDEPETLIFFEVKYRKSASYGYPVQAVDLKKQTKLRRCAEYYLAYKKNDSYIRFDVIAMEGEKITWYKNAF